MLGYGLDNMVFESLQKYEIFLVYQKLHSGCSAPHSALLQKCRIYFRGSNNQCAKLTTYLRIALMLRNTKTQTQCLLCSFMLSTQTTAPSLTFIYLFTNF
jgi:hypothetical protein